MSMNGVVNNLLGYRMTVESQKRLDAHVDRLIDEKCFGVDHHGWRIRGSVPQTRCRCGAIRWDDGTPCKNVVGGNIHKPIICGRYPEMVDRRDVVEEME